MLNDQLLREQHEKQKMCINDIGKPAIKKPDIAIIVQIYHGI